MELSQVEVVVLLNELRLRPVVEEELLQDRIRPLQTSLPTLGVESFRISAFGPWSREVEQIAQLQHARTVATNVIGAIRDPGVRSSIAASHSAGDTLKTSTRTRRIPCRIAGRRAVGQFEEICAVDVAKVGSRRIPASCRARVCS